jgi:hypothetical protein
MWREFETKVEGLVETPRPPINEEAEIDFRPAAERAVEAHKIARNEPLTFLIDRR